MNREIPIFFSTDDEYIPYLDVAIASLIENASKSFQYRIFVLNTGLKAENVARIKLNERSGFVIDFFDISKDLESIRARFKNVYHFSIVTYYRLFIASLFPQYDKIVYLDCDLVVEGDISELYNIDIGKNILGACQDQYVKNTEEFRAYTKKALGVEPEAYVNAGVLVMNLDEFRKNEIEKKFIELITNYDFDLLDPDQAYLNYLCSGKIYALPISWNRVPAPFACGGQKNIIHYALYKKPWQEDDVIDGEYFWNYARRSPFYEIILERKASFDSEKKAAKDAMTRDILVHARKIAESDYTIAARLGQPR